MKFFKKSLVVIPFAVVLLFRLPLFASGQKLVNGAGTLPGGLTAISLDLGLDIPEPIFYGVRADFGLGDRVQLGVGGFFLSSPIPLEFPVFLMLLNQKRRITS